MKTLTIRWQRLLDEKGQTCNRCGDTEAAMEDAVGKLRAVFAPQGIEVVLEKIAIDPSEFSKDTLESNRIWIDGKPLEEWVTGKVGQSRCCSVCGESDCRTVSVDGNVYEAIPTELILRVGKLAGVRLAQDMPSGNCCPTGSPCGER